MDATISATVGSTISLFLDETDLDLDDITTSGFNSGEITATVTTNNASGYTLGLKADGSTNMIGVTPTNTIPTGDDVQAGKSAWGYSLDGGTSYKALTTSDASILSAGTGGSTATDKDGDDYSVTFGVSIAANQAADTYTGKVTFTATAN